MKHSRSLLFADDFKLFIEVCTGDDCLSLQEDLASVVEWCNVNRFSLNPKKCSAMTFTLNKNVIDSDYIINETVLIKTSLQKDLGVIFDGSLNFTDHIATRINDAHRIMGFIVRSTRCFGVDVCIRLFDSLVLPKIEYGSIIWSPQYEIWSKSIERVQRKFLKYLFLKKFGYYPNQGYNHYALLGLFNRLSLENRRIKVCLIFLYKVLSNKINSNEILSKLPFSIKRSNTRQKNRFYLEFPRINVYKNSPIYRLCNLFNTYVNDVDIDTVTLKQFVRIVDEKLYASQALS